MRPVVPSSSNSLKNSAFSLATQTGPSVKTKPPLTSVATAPAGTGSEKAIPAGQSPPAGPRLPLAGGASGAPSLLSGAPPVSRSIAPSLGSASDVAPPVPPPAPPLAPARLPPPPPEGPAEDPPAGRAAAPPSAAARPPVLASPPPAASRPAQPASKSATRQTSRLVAQAVSSRWAVVIQGAFLDPPAAHEQRKIAGSAYAAVPAPCPTSRRDGIALPVPVGGNRRRTGSRPCRPRCALPARSAGRCSRR